jgi:hypothetical protein
MTPINSVPLRESDIVTIVLDAKTTTSPTIREVLRLPASDHTSFRRQPPPKAKPPISYRIKQNLRKRKKK